VAVVFIPVARSHVMHVPRYNQNGENMHRTIGLPATLCKPEGDFNGGYDKTTANIDRHG
jgi:hypothetical protein